MPLDMAWTEKVRNTNHEVIVNKTMAKHLFLKIFILASLACIYGDAEDGEKEWN
jgi:hypothetical protein